MGGQTIKPIKTVDMVCYLVNKYEAEFHLLEQSTLYKSIKSTSRSP